MRWCVAFLAAAAVGLPSVASRAKPWPVPAAGASSSGGPEIILTFDDGPHEVWTPRILAELERRDIQGIFFWVGRRLEDRGKAAQARRALVDRALAAGHLVGNHTMHHPNLCQVDADVAAEEIDRTQAMLESLAAMPVPLFRTPYGVRCDRLEKQLSTRNLAHMHWDIDPQEWKHHDPGAAARYVIGKLRHLEGRAVVLMHDTHRVTARALPQVLDWIEQENRRRQARGKRPFRIVSGPEWAAELLAPGLSSWLQIVAGSARDRLDTAMTSLIP